MPRSRLGEQMLQPSQPRGALRELRERPVGELRLWGASRVGQPRTAASTTGCRCRGHAASWMNRNLTSSGAGAIARASHRPSTHVRRERGVLGHRPLMHGRMIDRENAKSSGGHVFVEFERRHCSNPGLVTVRDDPKIAGLDHCCQLDLADAVEDMNLVDRAEPSAHGLVGLQPYHDQQADRPYRDLDERLFGPVVDRPCIDGAWSRQLVNPRRFRVARTPTSGSTPLGTTCARAETRVASSSDTTKFATPRSSMRR
jgi:hypothetical protein